MLPCPQHTTTHGQQTMTHETILIIEDETSIQRIICAYLEQAGYRLLLAATGPTGLELARQHHPDLIILDLNLPGMDGMEIAARLRAESDVFILILTARSDETDRVAGLRIGADDYLTKPFSPRELAARVEAILRRRRTTPPDNALRFRHLRIDPERRETWIDDHLIDLTTTEFDVLLALARHAGKVLNREQLIDLVWGTDFFGTDRVVDVYVGQVRRKLETALNGEELIRTIRGVGYKLVDERTP